MSSQFQLNYIQSDMRYWRTIQINLIVVQIIGEFRFVSQYAYAFRTPHEDSCFNPFFKYHIIKYHFIQNYISPFYLKWFLSNLKLTSEFGEQIMRKKLWHIQINWLVNCFYASSDLVLWKNIFVEFVEA